MPLIPGTMLGPYQILGPLGAGGMGEVYRALDPRLGRVVAVKTLADSLARDDVFRARFEREARTAAALSHPHVCTIFDVGPSYLVMELVEGETLATVLSRGPLPIDQALRYGSELADGLAAAHARGIVHRDLKPANVMVTPTGVKILDFGLAKEIAPIADDVETVTHATVEARTQAGQVLGTVAYMSPEQAEGKPVNARSDVFALGVLLYEMLTGRRPFQGETTLSIVASILRAAPDPLRRARADIPEHVERLVSRCLEKDPDARYPSAVDVHRELASYRATDTERRRRQRTTAIVLAAVVLVVAGGLAVRTFRNVSGARWVAQTAAPEIARLIATDRRFAALQLYREALQADPASRDLLAFSEALYAPALSIQTDPPGAEVYLSDYVDASEGGEDRWEPLGVSPLETERIPYAGYYRVRAMKAGFAPVEQPYDPVELGLTPSAGRLALKLWPEQDAPAGMIWVGPAAAAVRSGWNLVTPAAVPGFWLDKHEVTNRQFRAFVDAGAYQARDYWQESFVRQTRVLPWEQALAGFRDATSRPGPATWQLGSYPEGRADLPVGGVSWYEAAAYCAFAEKRLPTAFHWFQAAGVGFFSNIIQLSNFNGRGPESAGKNPGLSRYGALDMAGNLKEWVANPAGTNRAILGGSWEEPSYVYGGVDAQDPFERRETFGFRCARFVDPPPQPLFGPLPLAPDRADRRGEPVDDDVFEVYAALHAYDKTDLRARIESVDDSRPYLHKETVTFDAAYGNERVVAHLYLPTNTAPPYQIVVFVPSGNMLRFTSIETLPDPFEFLARAGRAVLVPAVKGALERGPSPLFVGPNQTRDRLLQWSKDLRRSIDYLETRPEIDTGKLAFYSISYAAAISPTLLATEPRVRTAVLVSAGLGPPAAAETDPWNYAPRVRVPVLMLNGRDDFISPVQTSQIPFLRALGAEEQDKRHVLYDGGHVNLQGRMDLIGEILNWLDRQLGPVTTAP